MDGKGWRRVYLHVHATAKELPPTPRVQHPDARIVLTFLWAVMNQRPISWACRRHNWPAHLRRHRLPSPATMSRRLRRPEVLLFLATLLMLIQRSMPRGSMAVIDGKPLPVGGYSKDPDAGFGRAAGVMARGYKLHALWDSCGRILAWSVASLKVSEQRAARDLLPAAGREACFVLGDANYDANTLYELAGEHGVQLLTHRRHPGARGLGHHRHSVHRRHAIRMLADGLRPLMRVRSGIERRFAHLGNFDQGLGPLPNWVRRQRRVRNWVHGKLILNAMRINARAMDGKGSR